MSARVLVTGGAGFIGSHVADDLLARGYRVRVLDSLEEQVHGTPARRPAYLASDVELIRGDIRDERAVRDSLRGVEAVIHLAGRVGVGQSMYQVGDYVAVNDHGTAVLLQALIEHPVGRLVVASSMSVYGEGLYLDDGGAPVTVGPRSFESMRSGLWEHTFRDGRTPRPAPTHEGVAPSLASVYAVSKYVQEKLCLLVGEAYAIPTVALRFFNSYGPRQALSNPYTGVLANFAVRLLNGRPPLVFEDGRQRRDFVHVRDVARAISLSLVAEGAGGRVINVASGVSLTVREAAEALARATGRPDLAPEVTGRCRIGDIRHCFADITLARDLLGFEPEVRLEDGMVELAEWLSRQIADDRIGDMHRELSVRGLSA